MLYLPPRTISADHPTAPRCFLGKEAAHLMADTDVELLEYARSIGMAPGWIQKRGTAYAHWVGSMAVEGEEQSVFDINCMCVGGWVSLSEWSQRVVPWLLKECQPKANGRWHLTHSIEIDAPREGEAGRGT